MSQKKIMWIIRFGTSLLFLVLLLPSLGLSFTVTCVTYDRSGRGLRYQSTYPRTKKSYIRRTAVFALKSCQRKSRWPRSCRLKGCRADVQQWLCQAFYVYRGRKQSFYQKGYNRRNSRFRAMRACASSRFRATYGLSCHYGACKGTSKRVY